MQEARGRRQEAGGRTSLSPLLPRTSAPLRLLGSLHAQLFLWAVLPVTFVSIARPSRGCTPTSERCGISWPGGIWTWPA